MPSDDPMRNIEDAHGQQGMGAMMCNIFIGARNEGASRLEAMFITAAWFLAMLSSTEDEKDDDENDGLTPP